ncbi:peptidylprolyl isomerase [Streptomyces sp. 150FB]|uniref:FKBP-type peptidyl-prolyl cis-trans isomerase n=1 Tax=Streptomyces sp. 150FB TaxID=1576605 RepID=UPI00058950CE|nr:FKBP-type peptidyl-prolyl cis-trans isomerase [Streptomyces sp. 150FB]KIF73687.1 peptidylprolyl isomerase [Streptomyces sp. 150FB]
MRRRLAALLILPALVLTACGGGGDSKKKDDGASAPTASASAAPSTPPQAPVPTPVASASPMPQIAGAEGKRATITLPKTAPTDKFVVSTLSEGKGATIKSGDYVQAHYTAKIWQSGKDLGSSYDKGGHRQFITAGQNTTIPAFSEAVKGKKDGSRILVVAPPAAAFGTQGNPQLGVGKKDTLVFVFDLEVMPKRAQGSQASIPKNLPQIKADKDAAATISVPKNDPPAGLVDQVLIQGKGDTVKAGQTIYMQYSGATWKPNEGKPSATLFDDSWKTGAPFITEIGTKKVIEGWDKGLVGKKVGSRVLLVIPSAMGYQDKAQGPIPANSTLVFVADILGIA